MHLEPDTRPAASILIVGYRSLARIERCIEGAIRSAAGEHVEILLIDCSDDGTEALVLDRFPQVRIVPSRGNLGFARAANLLAREARGRCILLLNPDAFARSDEISALIALSRRHPDANALGGICVDREGGIDPGSLQPMPGVRSLLYALVGLSRLRRGVADPARATPQAVHVLNGAFMMIRSDAWQRLGGFDERFFLYGEETDLCKRITDAGGTLLCDPAIRMLHEVGGGERRSPARLLNRSRGYATFLLKHHGPVGAWCGRFLLLLHASSRLMAGTVSGQQGHFGNFAVIVRRRREWWFGWPRGTTS